MLHVSLFLSVLLFGVISALELTGLEEGSCRRIPNIPTLQVDPAVLDSFQYILGGNKYLLYNIASVLPHFRQMRPFQFYYEACYTRNTSFVAGNGSIFGFGGRVLSSQTERGNGYFGLLPTLTDYRTFAVLITCLPGTDQIGWSVLSRLPQLDRATQRLVEDHAQDLGFKRENNVFLRRGNCERRGQPGGSQDGERRHNKQSGASRPPGTGGSLKRGIPSITTLRDIQTPPIVDLSSDFHGTGTGQRHDGSTGSSKRPVNSGTRTSVSYRF